MALLFLLFLAVPLAAQLAAPNAQGAAMGHLHFNSKDPAAHRKLWADTLGGAHVKYAGMDTYKFPDVLVLVRERESKGPSEGSVINHLGFKVRSLADTLAKVRANGFPVLSENPQTRQAFLMAPDEIRVELSEDAAMAAPVAHHHVHWYVPDDEAARAWYAKMFGAKPGVRGKFLAADLPGANLSFTKADKPAAPTKDRAMDHFGFEVKNLEAFCRKLEAMGVKFDVPFRDVPKIGLKLAFLTDPWGAYIELTEGLDKI